MSRGSINKLIFSAVILIVCGAFCPGLGAQGTADKQTDLNMQSPFGALEFLPWNHPWNNFKFATRKDLEKTVALMKEAGIGWVRMDFLWQDIEPQPQNFQFQKYDAIVEVLSRNNIHILGLLNYSTDWASSCGKWNCPPDTKQFVNYAAKVIGRYKDKVKYWELWNEPDSPTYWMPQDGLNSYCALLKEVYIAAKQIDPDCKILNGGLSAGLASVNRIYDNGAKDYFDILNIHIFETPVNDFAIKAAVSYPKLAYKIMSRNGDAHKKIWITEIGCPGVKKGLKVKEWWLGKNPTESQQAKWLKAIYTELPKNKVVERIFWAFFRDCKKHWDNGVDYFGIVRWDFSKKPAFDSYKKIFKTWQKSKRYSK